MKLKLKTSAVLIPIIVYLWTGLYGIDFGRHWDEGLLFDAIQNSINTGVWISNMYWYPSFYYYLGSSILIPYVFKFMMMGNVNIPLPAYLAHTVASHEFLLNTRTVFLFVSSLTIIWVWQLVEVWRKNWKESLLAACLLGLSWEVAYHGRWVATDLIMMQFGALSMLCLFVYLKQPAKVLWLVLAAAAAGLAFGTKYQGGLLFLPVLLACLASNESAGKKNIILKAGGLFLIFGTVFLLTTPGVLFKFDAFRSDLATQYQTQTTGNFGYTADQGAEHLSLMLTYLGLALFSKYLPIACFFTVMVLAGAFFCVKHERKQALVYLSFPLAYILYFGFCSRVMFVRNLMVTVPFFAVLAARGTVWMGEKISSRSMRCGKVFSGIVVFMLFVNGLWLVQSALSIKQMRTPGRMERQLIQYLDRHPKTTFWFSSQVADNIRAIDKKKRPNIVQDRSKNPDFCVFYSKEVDLDHFGLANRFRYTEHVFGPQEVNFDYYSSWYGPNRIVVMKTQFAEPIFYQHEMSKENGSA